jgi:hypothetical protein
VSFLADVSGALYCHGERTLLVADLHLEKGSSQAGRGALLPPYDTRETLERLRRAIDGYQPLRIIALGDSFQDTEAARRIGEEDLAALCELQAGRDWIWIAGNHDPAISSRVGGRVLPQARLGPLSLRHMPAPGAAHEIAGRRLVLPAFGAFTGGLNVLDAAFEPLFGSGGMDVWVLGQEGLYAVGRHLLSAD